MTHGFSFCLVIPSRHPIPFRDYRGTTQLAIACLVGGAACLAATPGAYAQASSGQVRTLTPVIVTGQLMERADLSPPAPGGELARGSHLGLLGNTDIMDTPFNTTSYTADFIENQQARTLADVVTHDSSVRVLTASGGFGDDFMIRGLPVPSGDVGLNGLYGLVSGNRMPVEVAERIEILKGPGSLLNGMAPSGSVGGGINIVTKRAGDEPLTRLTTDYRSDSQFGVHADIGRRFGEDKEWGVRFNGVYRNGEAGIEDQDQRTAIGSFGIDYTGTRLRWSLDAIAQNENIPNGVRPQISFNPGGDIPSAPDGDSNFYPGANLKFKDNIVATRLEYDITDQLTAFGALGWHESSVRQVFANGWADSNGDFDMNSGYYDSNATDVSGEVGLRGRFKTGPVGHTVTLSANRIHRDFGFFSSLSTTITPSNIYHPVDVPAPAGERGSPSKSSETTLTSYALADTLSLLDERVLLTLGARHQTVEMDNFNVETGARMSHYDEDAVTPLVGLVVKSWDHVSLYGNYTKGLSPGQIAPAGTANEGEAFAPYKSEQYEGGIKYDQGDIIASLSLFQIKRPSGTTDATTKIFSFGGEQRNRGIELNVYGELTNSLRIMGGATFIDAKLTHTAGGLNQGNDAPGVPRRAFNLGLEWDTPWVAGLSLNTQAIYTSSVYFDNANTQKLPSTVRYDVGARYATDIAGKDVTFRATIQNLTNENDWVLSNGWASVTAPRTFLLSAAVEF